MNMQTGLQDDNFLKYFKYGQGKEVNQEYWRG